MATPYPPVGFFVIVGKDQDQIEWTYVQDFPVLHQAADRLIERDPEPHILATKMARTMLLDKSLVDDQALLTGLYHAYGLALIKVGVAPFTVFMVQGGFVTKSFTIPATSAHAARQEFDTMMADLEASEAAIICDEEEAGELGEGL
jgi:hypothetical protein